MKGQLNFKRGFLYGAVAFVVHGSIAYFANADYPLADQLRATVGNGLFAWVMTLISTTTMEYFFQLPQHPAAKYVLSFSASGLIVLILITLLHLVLGTPNIWGTVVFSALVSLPYYLLFPAWLLREWKQKT